MIFSASFLGITYFLFKNHYYYKLFLTFCLIMYNGTKLYNKLNRKTTKHQINKII